MKTIRIKRMIPVILAVLLAAACAPPTTTPAATPTPTPVVYSISGTVRDSVTGAAVQNAAVLVGSDLAHTDASGAFSLSYSSGAALTTNVFVYQGTAYIFWGTYGVTINVASNPVYGFYLIPNDDSAYPTQTVSGAIPAAGSGARLDITVMNTGGGIKTTTVYPAAGATTYSVSTPTFGADCVVVVDYDDGSSPSPIKQYYQHVNLGAAAALDIADLADTAVTVSGTAGDVFFSHLDTNPVDIYCYVPMHYIPGPATSVSVDVYNPDAVPMIWMTAAGDNNTPQPNYTTIKMNIGNSTAFSSSVTLPASASGIAAPSEVVNLSLVSWTPGTRTIAFTGAAGATLHALEFTADAGYMGRILVNSPGASVVLPADFMTNVIGAGTGWNCKFMPISANRDLNTMIDMRISNDGPMNISDFQLCEIISNNDSDVFGDLIP
jgi:hypothetical protein